MYVEHFALTRPPFRAIASGQDVFLGPQTANTMKAIRKALLANQDAVVTVSGPVGIGKTAIVGRSLDVVGGKQTRIRIGRMSISHDEILDYLLDVLGVTNAPASTIRRIAMFRAILMQKRQEQERVFVIVEDGTRLGEDPLAEIEALTAADGGAGGGAAVIVMGDETLGPALDTPALARLNQRVRLRHSLGSLSEGELTGYLKHCFRLSGGDFDQFFEEGAAALLYQLTNGIPRVCNNLVESALEAAAEQGDGKLSIELLRKIAKDEYGLTRQSTTADVSQIAQALVMPNEDDAAKQTPDIELSQSMSVPMPDFATEMNAAAAASEEANTAAQADEDIPDLINDTVPELTALPNNLATEAAADDDIPTLDDPVAAETQAEETPTEPASPSAPAAEPAVELSLDEPVSAAAPAKPTAEPEVAAQAPEPAAPEPAAAELSLAGAEPTADPEAAQAPSAPANDDVPDWDKDPTLAELRPDMEALESAMAEVQSTANKEPEPETTAEPEVEVELQDPSLDDIPEINLEESIQQSINEAEEALQKHDSTIAEGQDADELAAAAPAPAEQEQKADGELEKIARGLARAKTLDDVDDQMAETLFGEEFSMIAAEVAASVANMNLDEEEEVEEQAEPVAPAPAAAAPAAKPAPQAPAQDQAGQAAAKPAPAATPAASPASKARVDSSPSARLKTVQALNAAKAAPAQADATAKPAAASTAPAAPAAGEPASIENQFADIAPAPKNAQAAPVIDDDDDEDEDNGKKGGFFSRFKR